jgi:hypothetical protein
MAVILKIPLQQKVFLNLPTDIDPDQDTYVEVRQATQREVEKRADLTADASRIFRDGSQEVEVRQRWSVEEQKRLEVWLTLAGSNLVTEDSDHPEGQRPLFRFQKIKNSYMLAMTEEQFKEAWGSLPEVVATSIHAAVLKVNPQWNPNYKAPSTVS